MTARQYDAPDCAGRNGAHTPGPWKHHEPTAVINDHRVMSGEDKVADINPRFGADEVAANARLIAAAPELLEALVATRALVSEAAMTGFNCHDGTWAERLYSNQASLSAAIAKAEGRS